MTALNMLQFVWYAPDSRISPNWSKPKKLRKRSSWNLAEKSRCSSKQPWESQKELWGEILLWNPPLPNAKRCPHLETGSHSYVRRVCPRLENAPKTTATNNPVIVSDDNSSRESDDKEPSRLTPPPKFKISSAPPHKDCLEPLNPKGKQLVRQHILAIIIIQVARLKQSSWYKWHGYGWCQGIITNDNSATVMGTD